MPFKARPVSICATERAKNTCRAAAAASNVETHDRKWRKRWFLAAMVGIIVVYFFYQSGPPETKEQQYAKTCSSTLAAYGISEKFVTSRLRAPKTADFSGYRNATVDYLGDCRHRVIASSICKTLLERCSDQNISRLSNTREMMISTTPTIFWKISASTQIDRSQFVARHNARSITTNKFVWLRCSALQ